MNKLAIVKLTDDKGAESYYKALKKRFKDNIVLFDDSSKLEKELEEFFKKNPLSEYLVLEPCNNGIGNLLRWRFGFDLERVERYPITPTAIYGHLADMTDLKGKCVCILNRTDRLGKPLAIMLVDAGATVTICSSYTHAGYRLATAQNADIVISATNGAYNYRPMAEQIVIDCSNEVLTTFRPNDNVKFISSSQVGKWTLDELERRLENERF